MLACSPKPPAKVRSACSADLVLPPIGSLEPLRFSLVANHLIWLILEGAAGYIERIRHTRCRQANGRRAESDGNNLKTIDKRPNHQLGFNALPPSWKLAANGRWFLYFQQMASVFPADGFCISSRWFLYFQQMASLFSADGFCVSMMPSSLAANSMPYNRSRWCS